MWSGGILRSRFFHHSVSLPAGLKVAASIPEQPVGLLRERLRSGAPRTGRRPQDNSGQPHANVSALKHGAPGDAQSASGDRSRVCPDLTLRGKFRYSHNQSFMCVPRSDLR